MKAADIMTRRVISVAPEASILESARLMLQHRVSGLPVIDAAGRLVGVVTEGDFLRRVEAGTQRKRPRWLEFFAGPVQFGADGPNLIVLYSIIPWIGVMAAGYAFGKIVILEPAQRKRLCLAIGLSAIGLFLVLRGFNLYGDPRPWHISVVSGNGSPSMPAL